MFIGSMDAPSMLEPECSLGLLAVSGREKHLKPSMRAGFFRLFSFLSDVLLLVSLLPTFAFKSCKILFQLLPLSPPPCCLSACSSHCFCVRSKQLPVIGLELLCNYL